MRVSDMDPVWQEYDDAAEWVARRGYTGALGDPLPRLLSYKCHEIIADDPEAFQRRVEETAYMLARTSRAGSAS